MTDAELASVLENLANKSVPGPYHKQRTEGKAKARIACAPDKTGHQHTFCTIQHYNSQIHSKLLLHLLNNVPIIVAALRR